MTQATESAVGAVIDQWPKYTRESAELVIKRYGPPDEITESMLVWHQRAAHATGEVDRGGTGVAQRCAGGDRGCADVRAGLARAHCRERDAERTGDAQRHDAPHGEAPNRGEKVVDGPETQGPLLAGQRGLVENDDLAIKPVDSCASAGVEVEAGRSPPIAGAARWSRRAYDASARL